MGARGQVSAEAAQKTWLGYGGSEKSFEETFPDLADQAECPLASLRRMIAKIGTCGETSIMPGAFRYLFAGCCVLASFAPSAGADADHGKQIAERWCASCHLVERGQESATDQAPPFAYLARTPDLDENKLAFLLLLPHPNMPRVSLSRTEAADLADYIRSVK